MSADGERERARTRRRVAARKYRPEDVRLLLVAEAPPGALDRYFYFEDVREHDALFRYVCKVVLGEIPERADKARFLRRMRDEGTYLIDVQQDPRDSTPLKHLTAALVARCRRLSPQKIILIKATVYDAAYQALRQAQLPVVDVRVPFPGNGQQRRFEEAFARALAVDPTRESGA